MDKIPTIGGARGIFEIFVPGLFLLLNLVATVYLLPFTDQATKEQIKGLGSEPFLLLLLAIPFGYLAGVLLRLFRTEVPDRLSARVVRLYDRNARRGKTPNNQYAYERFPYNQWMATVTKRLPSPAQDFYKLVWDGRSSRTFINFCKVTVSAEDAAAAAEIYVAEALSRYISGMFYALVASLFLIAALVTLRAVTGTPVPVGLRVILLAYVVGTVVILANFRFIRLKEVETIFAATFKNRRLFEVHPSVSDLGEPDGRDVHDRREASGT